MAEDFGMTEQGLVVPRSSDLLTLFRRRFEESTGLKPDWERDELLGTVSVILADLGGRAGEALVAVGDALDDNNATGTQIESIAAISPGIRAKVAAPSLVFVVVSGDPGTVIPAGFQVQGGGADGLALWRSRSDSAIESGGTVSIQFESLDVGAIRADAGDIQGISTPILGVDSVSNPSEAVEGRLDETSDELRIRRRQSLALSGVSGLGAIRAAVLGLPFITDARVVENDQAVDRDVGGVVLPRNSIAVFVQPSPLATDQIETLAKVLYSQSPAGIQLFGDVSATVTGADDLEKEVAFSYGAELLVSVQVIAQPAPGFAWSTARAAIQTAVIGYFDTLGLGDPVRRLELLQLIAQTGTVQTAAVGLNLAFVDVVPGPLQIATLDVSASTTTQGGA